MYAILVLHTTAESVSNKVSWKSILYKLHIKFGKHGVDKVKNFSIQKYLKVISAFALALQAEKKN